jgi:hypothetical protein
MQRLQLLRIKWTNPKGIRKQNAYIQFRLVSFSLFVILSRIIVIILGMIDIFNGKKNIGEYCMLKSSKINKIDCLSYYCSILKQTNVNFIQLFNLFFIFKL